MTYWSLLAPKAISSDPFRIRGGRPEVTADDVRQALGGLDDRAMAYGMAAFLDHAGSFNRCVAFLDYDLMDHAYAGDWVKKDIDRYRITRMAELAMRESMAARSRHETYAGQEKLPAGSVVMKCPSCLGKGVELDGTACRTCYRKKYKTSDGRLVVTDIVRYTAMGLSHRTWHRHWNDRYAIATETLSEWEARAIRHVSKRLRR